MNSSQTDSYINFENLLPDIIKPPYDQEIKFLTLTDIGVKSSYAASKLGFICVQKSYAKGARTYPGLWITATQYPKLESVARTIRAEHLEQARLETERKAEKLKRRELAKQKQLAKLVRQRGELRSEVDGRIAEMAETIWNKEELDILIDKAIENVVPLESAMCILFRCLTHHLRLTDRVEIPAADVFGQVLIVGPATVGTVTRTIKVPVPIGAVWALLLANNMDALTSLFMEKSPAYLERALKLIETAPSWLLSDSVVDWALRECGRATPSKSCISYVMDTISPSKLQSLGFTIRAKHKADLNVKVLFSSPDQNDLSAVITLDKGYVNGLLNQIESATCLSDAIAQARQKATEECRSKVDRIANAAVNTLSESVYKDIIERDRLVAIAAYHVIAVLRSNNRALLDGTNVIGRIKPALITKCEEVKAYKIAEQCRRALPSRLADFYPLARSLNRKLTLVIGPTNSGKTHAALERFRNSDSGAYLAPLRLLALEVRDSLAEQGLPVSLVTGELLEIVPNARHCSSTIEMLDFSQQVDMAIVDEVQMLADPQRGSAWLQAVIGAPAKEVWMLGSPESEHAVISLANYMNEPIEVVYTERLAPLETANKAFTLDQIPKQGALIAFSRQDVLSLAGELREKHRRSPAVIYGALSPEVRREQARRFREGLADCVVATDAIGMGLNLPITTIVFSTSRKYNGSFESDIPSWLVWQIAGRAGRYGQHESGIVSAVDRHTLSFIKKTLTRRPERIASKLMYGPSWPIVQTISEYLDTAKLAQILEFFTDKMTLPDSDRFIPGVDDDVKTISRSLDTLNLTLREKHSFLGAPVPINKGVADECLQTFAKAVESKQSLVIHSLQHYQSEQAAHSHLAAEHAVKVLTLYCWLYYRYPEYFPDFVSAMEEINKLNVVIARYLTKAKPRCCPECGRKISWNHKFRICESCFLSRRSFRGDIGDWD
ncbi:MAG: helicase-related protein [Dissulfurispiraceae bacterium]